MFYCKNNCNKVGITYAIDPKTNNIFEKDEKGQLVKARLTGKEFLEGEMAKYMNKTEISIDYNRDKAMKELDIPAFD